MILNVTVDTRTFKIDVPQEVLDEGETMFENMDRDMDKGWQMSRDYVEAPDQTQRCQIAADRLLTAIHNDKRPTMLMMAGYILTRLPSVTQVNIDNTGNIQETTFFFNKQSAG